jgi:hypothetical protein
LWSRFTNASTAASMPMVSSLPSFIVSRTPCLVVQRLRICLLTVGLSAFGNNAPGTLRTPGDSYVFGFPRFLRSRVSDDANSRSAGYASLRGGLGGAAFDFVEEVQQQNVVGTAAGDFDAKPSRSDCV